MNAVAPRGWLASTLSTPRAEKASHPPTPKLGLEDTGLAGPQNIIVHHDPHQRPAPSRAHPSCASQVGKPLPAARPVSPAAGKAKGIARASLAAEGQMRSGQSTPCSFPPLQTPPIHESSHHTR